MQQFTANKLYSLITPVFLLPCTRTQAFVTIAFLPPLSAIALLLSFKAIMLLTALRPVYSHLQYSGGNKRNNNNNNKKSVSVLSGPGVYSSLGNVWAKSLEDVQFLAYILVRGKIHLI